ncbi:hypothetical protein DIT68_14110 [Brumimicrobium oceani]|uniref:Uncharacterized protein n=2 Tax=Brumimicrobium oceani TaxID=2100725 RepID=A0A2U2X3A6_9FLAO|nr:hypothetical protein DIT68_14110 [Brumimicrobium oceani]
MYISILLLVISCTPEKQTCSDFRTGTFEYTAPESNHIRIIRTENTQVEINSETKIEAHTSIEWVSDCKYILTYEEFKNAPEEFNDMVGQKISAEIVEIGKDRYTCQVKTKNASDLMELKLIKE